MEPNTAVESPLAATQRLQQRQQANQPIPTNNAGETARATSVTPAEQPKLTQADLIEGGTSKVEVKINPKTMAELLDRMKIKAKHAKSIQDRQGELSPTDTYLLRTDVIQRLESGQLTREDYIIALLDINDELSQKASVAGKLVSETKGSILRHIPIVGIIAARPETRFENVRSVPTDKSSYAKEVGYTSTEAELTQLNDLRIQLNESLFGKGFRDPLFDEINTSIYPSRLLAESRHDVYREIGRQIENIIAERVKVGTLPLGETPQNLWATNRREMALVVREANHRALEQMTLDKATAILKSPPEISRQAITDRANALKQAPTREELAALEDAKTKAEAEQAEAQQKYDVLKQEYDDLTRKSKNKDRTSRQVANFRTSHGDRTAGQIRTLEDSIANSDAIIAGLTDPVTKQAEQGRRDRSQTELNNLVGQLNRLLDEEASADIEFGAPEQARLTAIGTHTQGATPPTNEFVAIETELATKKTTAKNAGETHAARVKELDAGPSAESKQKSSDLEEWGKTVDGYPTIMDTQRKQKAGDPYVLDRLRDSSLRADGQIEGAERIRESIFLVANPSGYSPEQARRLASNDAISKGIIHIYDLPIDITMGPSGNTLRQIGLDIETYQQRLDTLLAMDPALRMPNYDTLVAIARTNINNNQNELTQTTISNISPTDRVKALRLLDFLVKEGAKSAQKGNPYLEIDRHYYNT